MKYKTLVIEKNFPIPSRYIEGSTMDAMRRAMKRMTVGDSFAVDVNNRHCYTAARAVGIRIKIQKLNGVGYRVWKIGKAKD